MNSKPSPTETYTHGLIQQEDAKRSSEASQVDSSLNQFSGPVDKSPFYKSLYTAGMEGTSRAYTNAKANVRGQAHAAGFGYEQPIAEGANAEMEQAEAHDLADVPRNALTAATAPTLAAANTRMGLVSDFNPNPTLGTLGTLEEARKKRQDQMSQQLAQMAMMAAAAGG